MSLEARTDAAGTVHVRNTSDPDGPVLVFTIEEWGPFLLGVKAGEFDPGEEP